MRDLLTVYDQDLQVLSTLDFAQGVSYSLKNNDLATAAFSLPAGDPANALCQPHNIVRIPDPARDIGLFRLVTMPSHDKVKQQGVATYNLEHVMATLLDDPLFGYHEIGGTGIYTAEVIRYILKYQAVKRWQLGVCEFSDQFAYNFENTSLLTALLSLGEVIVEDFTWEFDTSSYPWTINLRRADSTPGCGIYYQRNMTSISKSWDAGTLVTRLYLLGYGEGVNQLNIEKINNNLPYIDANTGKWGIKSGIFVDTRIEDAATLRARGRVLQNKVKDPYFSYTASAIDLAGMTGYDWDRFMPGKLVHVEDGEQNTNLDARIVSIDKPNVLGDPGNINITIANATRDVADSINTLADRMAVHELYSQGSISLFPQQFADNADASHPAKMRVYIPSECVRINKVLLSWELANFRAYETGAAAGGGGTVSSEAGGGEPVTSEDGGGGTQTSRVNSSPGTTSEPSSKDTVSVSGIMTSASNQSYTSSERASTWIQGTTKSSSASGTHSHDIDLGYLDSQTHRHDIKDHWHYFDHSHNISHTHQFTAPPHTHDLDLPPHSHTVRIEPHRHDVTFEDHVHAIIYGIYEGGRASIVTIKVDGNTVPSASVSANGMDVVPWLAKDSDGKITRGTWHEIQIVPNALTRIEANLFAQIFVQSRGGGDY